MTKAEIVLNKLADTDLNKANDIRSYIATSAKETKQTGNIEPYARMSKGIQAAKQHPLITNSELRNFKQLKLSLTPLLKNANKHFTEQHRPKKVKEIYSAIKREHPGYSAGKKARIANATYDKMK